MFQVWGGGRQGGVQVQIWQWGGVRDRYGDHCQEQLRQGQRSRRGSWRRHWKGGLKLHEGIINKYSAMSLWTWRVIIRTLYHHDLHMPLSWQAPCFSLIFCFPLCMQQRDYVMSMNKTVTPGRNGCRGKVITKLRWFCAHYNGILLHYINNCYQLLSCFSVSLLYNPVQKLICWFRPTTPKTL